MTQLRALDPPKSGSILGVLALLGFYGALLGESLRVGPMVVSDLNLGGGIDPVHDARA